MLLDAFSWLGAATPVWLSLCLLAACAGLALRLWRITQRIDRHARSIAHMDEWADMVDDKLTRIEDRARRSASLRPPGEMKKWWQG